jgi:penicillin-binding protein 2
MESYSETKTQSWLSWFLRGILVLVFGILFARVFELQVIKGAYYQNLADGNRVRRVAITAPRGNIYSNEGKVLVGNKTIKKMLSFKPDVGFEILDIWGDEDGEIVDFPVRDYKLGENFSHVSGYVGEISSNELGKVNPLCPEKRAFKMGDLIGRSGLESFYNCLLTGVDGEELVEVDSFGNKIRTLGIRKPIAGEDLVTNINYEIQAQILALMEGKKGSILVSDTQGRIKAMASSPSFDPNAFVSKENTKIENYLKSEDLPMLNRNISGTFQPGSIYKPIISTALLEEGVVNSEYLYNDQGYIEIKTLYGDFRYRNWYFTQYGGVEGNIDITRALSRSTDTFFYETGGKLGIDKIVEWSGKFGLGSKTGIDLPGEIQGLIPTPEWKERVKGERWFLGNTYHLSIGQGDMLVTPIEIHNALAAIASDGVLCEPRIAGDGVCSKLNISKESLDLVREGMLKACQSGGTGYTFFDAPIQVGCKTGTAQTNDPVKTHAWFVFFAPFDNPEVVVTVFVERGGEGSRDAGPIAREIYDLIFKDYEDGI